MRAACHRICLPPARPGGDRVAGIRDDLETAGSRWVDEPVVVDGHLISSRTPRDLAPFGKAMVEFLEAKFGPATKL